MNKRGTGIAEVIFIIVMLGCLVAPFALFGLWWWFFCMLTIAAIVGIFEIVDNIRTGKTISQQFLAWSLEVAPWKVWTVIFTLAIGWAFLLIHLSWKLVSNIIGA